MRWFNLSRVPSDVTEPEEPKPSVQTALLGHSFNPAEALRHYEYPGVPIPPSARVGDPRLKQRESEPLRLWHLWKYGTFAAVKGECLPGPFRIPCTSLHRRRVPFRAQASRTIRQSF